MLISSISRQKFFDIHEENCSLLSSTSPAFIYLKFVCDEMKLWAWFWKARYWQHETFLETNWRWGDTNFMSHAAEAAFALLGFLGNMSSQDHLLQLLKLLQTKPLFYCTFCSAFSLDKFCGLCHTILLSKSRCVLYCCVPHYGKTLILVQKLDSPYLTRHFCTKLQYFPN